MYIYIYIMLLFFLQNKNFRNYTPCLVYVVTSLPANSNTLVHNAW